MTKGLGVKIRKLNSILPLKGYKEDTLVAGKPVIIETDRGLEYGWIVKTYAEKGRKAGFDVKIRKVLRYADEKDIEQAKSLDLKEKDILCTACSKLKNYDMPIKLVWVEMLFDESKVMLYYKVTDAKKNFSVKDAVKDLSGALGKKVEMHSLGPRDESRLLSGIGICGRRLCCDSFLDDFAHISVKMLKEQGIQINQSKICGLCGKLLCCLRYEEEQK